MHKMKCEICDEIIQNKTSPKVHFCSPKGIKNVKHGELVMKTWNIECECCAVFGNTSDHPIAILHKDNCWTEPASRESCCELPSGLGENNLRLLVDTDNIIHMMLVDYLDTGNLNWNNLYFNIVSNCDDD